MGSWRAGSSNYFPFFLCFPWTHPHGVSVKLYTRTTVHGTEKQPLNQPIINFISLWETLPQTTFILPLLFTSNSGQEVMSVMSDFAGQASPQFPATSCSPKHGGRTALATSSYGSRQTVTVALLLVTVSGENIG